MAATLQEKRQWMRELFELGEIDYGNGRYEDEYNSEKYEQYTAILGNMIREGMVVDAVTGEVVKPEAEKLSDDQKDRVGSYLIRADKNDDPYVLNVKETAGSTPEMPAVDSVSLRDTPMTKQEYAEKNCKPLPKEPGRMSRFWDSIVRNVFRVKEGSETCRKYREEKALVEKQNYYKLTDAGFKADKPESLAKEERETAVRAYVLAEHQEKVGTADIGTFDPEKDPEYNRMMNHPAIDAFVDRPETQNMLKKFRKDNISLSDLKKVGAEYIGSRQNSEYHPEIADFRKAGEIFGEKGLTGLASENRKKMLDQASADMLDTVREKLGGAEKAEKNGAFLDDLAKLAGQDNELGRKVCNLFKDLPAECVQGLAAEHAEMNGNESYDLGRTLGGIFEGKPGAMAELNNWTMKAAQNSNNGPQLK